MSTVYGNNVGYGSIGNYYRAEIDYTVSYPSDTESRVDWELYVYVTGSISDVNNSAGASGDLENDTYGSQTYSFGSGGGTKSYASGTEWFDRSYNSSVNVDQEFWVQGLADGVGGGARSTVYLDIDLDPRPASAPSKPSTPTVTSVQQNQATVNMSLPSANGSAIYDTGFWIYDAASGGSIVVSDSGVSTQTSWVATGLSPSTAYWAEVAARNSVGWSTHSNRRSFTTPAPTTPNAPGAPATANLTATSVDLSWTTPADNGAVISGYQLQVSNDALFSDLLLDENLSASPRTGITLEEYHAYWARVRALSNTGYSSWSTVTEFDTGIQVPDAPGNPTVSSIYGDRVTFSFDEPNLYGYPALGYQVQVVDVYGFIILDEAVLDTAVFGTFYYDEESLDLSRLITGLVSGSTYYVHVRARTAIGYGAWTTPLSFSTYEGVHLNVSGLWKNAQLFVNVGGVWKSASLYQNVGGVWKQVVA